MEAQVVPGLEPLKRVEFMIIERGAQYSVALLFSTFVVQIGLPPRPMPFVSPWPAGGCKRVKWWICCHGMSCARGSWVRVREKDRVREGSFAFDLCKVNVCRIGKPLHRFLSPSSLPLVFPFIFFPL